MAAQAASDKTAGGRKGSAIGSTIVELLIVTVIAAGLGFWLEPQSAGGGQVPRGEDDVRGRVQGGRVQGGRRQGGRRQGGREEPRLRDGAPHHRSAADRHQPRRAVDTWIRVEASIVFDPKTMEHPEIVGAEIATDELAYLRTLALPDLQGPIGLANIRQDLADRAMIRSGGKVSEFIFEPWWSNEARSRSPSSLVSFLSRPRGRRRSISAR